MSITRRVYDQLWGFDPHMRSWGVEDLDFGLKAWLTGHPLLHDPAAVVGHRFRKTFDNFTVPTEHLWANQLRMARKHFTEATWSAWVQQFRKQHEKCGCHGSGAMSADARLDLLEHPEGPWARAWETFLTDRASVEQERAYILSQRRHDEFWFAERFGLDWPRVEGGPAKVTQAPIPDNVELVRTGTTLAAIASPSPQPSPSPSPEPCACELTGLSVSSEIAEVGETLTWMAEGHELDCLEWQLIERPASSQAVLQISGTSATVTTDEPGEYVVRVGCLNVFLAAPATAYRLRIVRGGQTINDTNQSTTVGERISLSAIIVPIPPGVEYQWNIPGSVVSGYNIALEAGSVEPLTPAGRRSNTVHFHWTDKVARESVQVEVSAQGRVFSKSVTFSVRKPRGVLSAVTTTHVPPVSLGQHPIYGTHNTIAFAYGWYVALDTYSVGITFVGSVEDSADFSGTIAILQLIDSLREQRDDDGNVYRASTEREFVIDPHPLHRTIFKDPVDISEEVDFQDAPGIGLLDDAVYLKNTDTFLTYLMYRPAGANSIWVTLSRIGWYCSGEYDYDANRDPQWQSIQSSHRPNPSGVEASELPEWNDHFLNHNTLRLVTP